MYCCSDCFANKASFTDKGCVALVEKPKGDHCPFKKTRTQYDFDRKKAGRRLKKMYQNGTLDPKDFMFMEEKIFDAMREAE